MDSKYYPNPKKSMIDAFKNKVLNKEELEEDDDGDDDGAEDDEEAKATTTKSVYCICRSSDTQRFMM